MAPTPPLNRLPDLGGARLGGLRVLNPRQKLQKARDWRGKLGLRPQSASRRCLRILLAGGALVISVASCGDPIAALPCTVTVAGNCWTYLGPADLVFAVAEVQGELWIGTSTRGILRYDAGSRTWQSQAFDGKTVRSIVVAPSTGAIWATVSGAAYPDTTLSVLYASRDRGRTWQPTDGGLSGTEDFHGTGRQLAIDPFDPDHLVLTSSGGVALSEDGGATWSAVLPTTGTVLAYIAVAVSPADGDRVWVGGTNLTFESQVALRSDDGGRSWSEVSPPRPNGYGSGIVASLLPDPARVGVVLASTWGSLCLTDDAGDTWRSVLDLRHGAGYVEAFARTDTMVVAVSNEWISDTLPGVLGLYTAASVSGPWTAIPAPGNAEGGFAVVVRHDGELMIGTRQGTWLVRR